MTLLVAGCAVVLLLVTGLVVDLGLARDVRAQSQSAADASALAAGNILYDGTSLPDVPGAVAAAQAYASANLDVSAADWASCTDTERLPHTTTAGPCISFDDATQPSVVRVRMPTRVVDTHFGGLAGVSTVSIATSAQVALLPGKVFECALCVLGDGPHDIGNGDVTVTGSGVHLNGSVSLNAQGKVVADHITVEGSASGHEFVPAAEMHAGRMDDPLASLAMPPAAMAGLSAKTDPCTGGPGVYGAYVFPKSTCTLAPGLYVLTGEWVLSNNSDLRGAGVTLYATCGTAAAPRVCAAQEAGGELDAKNGDLQLSGGAVPGFTVLYDRNNTSDLSLQGNGLTTSVEGSVYAASAKFYANGNTVRAFRNGSIVVDSIDFNGNIRLDIADGFGRTWQRPPGGLHLER
ncbi:MAG: pilus assembly protein TadG-related protein [Nocardioides sp.]|nr:pilus assembly protein TadG-related protein [Nocardioides sp.]